MAGPVPLPFDRDAWCREKLEFVCAIVNNVDRESLKSQLEICETDDDVEGILQSLLWLQDIQSEQQPQNPTAPDEVLDYVADPLPEEFNPTARDNALLPQQYNAENRQNLYDIDDIRSQVVMNQAIHVFEQNEVQNNDQDQQHLLYHLHEENLQQWDTPNPTHDVGEGESQPMPDPVYYVTVSAACEDDHIHQRQEGSGHLQLGEEDSLGFVHLSEDHNYASPEGQMNADSEIPSTSCVDAERFEIESDAEHNFQMGAGCVMHGRVDDGAFKRMAEQLYAEAEVLTNQESMEHDQACTQNQLNRKRQKSVQNDSEQGVESDNETEQVQNYIQEQQMQNDDDEEQVQIASDDSEKEQVNDSDEEPVYNDSEGDQDVFGDVVEDDQDVFGDVVEYPNDENQRQGDTEPEQDADCGEPQEDPQDDLLNSMAEERNEEFVTPDGSVAISMPVDPSAIEDDDSEWETVEDDEDIEENGNEADGAYGGIAEEVAEEVNIDTEGDEEFARRLAEELEREEEEKVREDEAFARELEEQLQQEELAREAMDEAYARQLEQNEGEPVIVQANGLPPVDSEDEEEQAQGGDPVGEILNMEEMMARQMRHEVEARYVERDEDLARVLQEEEQEEIQLEVGTATTTVCWLVDLMTMFPDADPTYLQERYAAVSEGSEEQFQQLVETLLQQQKTEPQMSGYLKRQKEAAAARNMPDFQEPSTSTGTDLVADIRRKKQPLQLKECTICFEEQVPNTDMATCVYNVHEFCIECIRKHVKVLIGQGLTKFKCMNGYCEAEFSWRTLRRVMEPVVYVRMAQRRQEEEVVAAGLEDLVACPFCSFMVVMPDPNNKVLECLNPECMKESCRECKEESHIPLRCNEVEGKHQTDARVTLENQMAEAMIRMCPKCNKRFIIESGCNKMTCPCGAVMCYLCKQVITDGYHHFEQRQNVNSGKCPLWSNAETVHTTEVREAATRARQELDPNLNLVHDPTQDLV